MMSDSRDVIIITSVSPHVHHVAMHAARHVLNTHHHLEMEALNQLSSFQPILSLVDLLPNVSYCFGVSGIIVIIVMTYHQHNVT